MTRFATLIIAVSFCSSNAASHVRIALQIDAQSGSKELLLRLEAAQ
jgi:hypothetical protein